jgi:hypothetical protein
MRVVSAFADLECTHCRNQDPHGKQEHRYLVEVATAKCGESIRLCVGCARRAAALAVAWTGQGKPEGRTD